jgi:hypothetical protein
VQVPVVHVGAAPVVLHTCRQVPPTQTAPGTQELANMHDPPIAVSPGLAHCAVPMTA